MNHLAQPRESTRARTIAELLPRAAELFGDTPAIRHKQDGAWRDITFGQLATQTAEIGRGLIALGVGPGERVCILSGTRPEWTAAALGIARAGAVIVPIYPTSSPAECAWILADSGAVAVICEGPTELAKVAAVADELPALREVITFIPTADALCVEDLQTEGRRVEASALTERTSAVRPEDRFVIVYTSGTTGPPKGCVHTHRSYRAGLDTIRVRDALKGPDDLLYLFLPLAHAFALMIQLAACDVGTPVAYYGGDARRIVAELAEVRPTFLPSVPRIFEKVFGQVCGGVTAGELTEAARIGGRVHDLRHAGRAVPTDLDRAYERLDAALFAKVRAVFGGRLREAASGAAPIAPEILSFFYAAGVPVMEGWGLTETAVGVTTSAPQQHRFGTVGRAVPGVELRIADDGEILVRGDNVFVGYHNNPVATAAALVEGWLHTGDIGSIDADGFLSISGRKKDIIITAGGKNLTPANIENDVRRSPWISHAVMYGDRRSYPVLLVTLDEPEIAPWARQRGLPVDIATLSRHPEVRAAIQTVLDKANAQYSQTAQVKRFAILDHDFSPENGELTPSLKVRRNVVAERYAAIFDALYDAG